jgi:hypothetical protein
MIILCHFYTHSLLIGLFLYELHVLTQCGYHQVRMKVWIHYTETVLLIYIPDLVWSNNNIKYKISGLECC